MPMKVLRRVGAKNNSPRMKRHLTRTRSSEWTLCGLEVWRRMQLEWVATPSCMWLWWRRARSEVATDWNLPKSSRFWRRPWTATLSSLVSFLLAMKAVRWITTSCSYMIRSQVVETTTNQIHRHRARLQRPPGRCLLLSWIHLLRFFPLTSCQPSATSGSTSSLVAWIQTGAGQRRGAATWRGC